jgi:hypothetical protein
VCVARWEQRSKIDILDQTRSSYEHEMYLIVKL